MDAVAAVPPYAHVTQEAVQCVAQASSRYGVPELLLHAILTKENGRMGKVVRNRNGTYDMGMAQINTTWVEYFAKYGVRKEHLLHDTCTNISAAAYILKSNYLKKDNDWFKAIVSYNIGPNRWDDAQRYAIGYRYATDVVRRWWGFHEWVTKHGAQAVQATSSPTSSASSSVNAGLRTEISRISPDTAQR